MTVLEFLAEYPQYGVDIYKRMAEQSVVYDNDILSTLPQELTPDFPARKRKGGRGRRNYNNTLTHHQCKVCERVLRNDSFWAPQSMQSRNMINPTCKDCAKPIQAARYGQRSDMLRARRDAIWQYLAPKCELCGFDKHVAAIDFHHVRDKDTLVSKQIAAFAQYATIAKAEKILNEVAKCVPLCSNCHRLIHVGVIKLPHDIQAHYYDPSALVALVTNIN